MEVATQSVPSVSSFSLANYSQNPAADADSLVLSALDDGSSSGDAASVSLDFGSIYKSLSVGTKELIDKINAALGNSLPGGVQSLKPEDVTPDATATKIVQGIAGLFDTFAKQNPDLSAEDLLSKFMEQARKGVEQGFGDAVSTLDNLGAFQFDGVRGGIDQTKQLIEEKLKAFEAQKRKELGLDPAAGDVSTQTAQTTKSSVLAQSGGGILSLAA